MDKLLNKKNFHYLDRNFSKTEYKNLKIVCVFGGFGFDRAMICVTQEDRVYALGCNDDGCLGLGLRDAFIPKPRLNTTLSYKQLVSISYGFRHCIALTSDGKCYSWGDNRKGQLGVGMGAVFSPTPLLIDRLANKRVAQMSCGNEHNLVLTELGEVYAWGRNSMGEVGNRQWTNVYWPTLIPLYGRVVSVSCGKSHSLALMANGLVYIWGNNKFGQLGQKTICNPKRGNYRSSNRPELIDTLVIHVITKAICGPNHSLLLTSEGDIYSFGFNEFGQVGNGSKDNQFFPVRVNHKIKFKDIFASYKDHLSIGLSKENKYYFWGIHANENTLIMSPKELPNVYNHSLHEIYAYLTEYKTTYKTINRDIEERTGFCPSIEDKDIEINYSSNDENSITTGNESIGVNERTFINSCNNVSIGSNQIITISEVSKSTETLSSVQTLNTESNDLNNNLNESFNESNDNIITFRFNDQYIYGNKEFFKNRNKKFWLKCEQLLSEGNEIRFDHSVSYRSFNEFIQYLYTNSADIDCEIVVDLLSLANIYGEEVLKEKCLQLLSKSIDLKNICELYSKAILQNIKELEQICILFVAKNFKHCLSQEFQDMNDSLTKNLIISSLEMTRFK